MQAGISHPVWDAKGRGFKSRCPDRNTKEAHHEPLLLCYMNVELQEKSSLFLQFI
jgi:hypothetical protein